MDEVLFGCGNNTFFQLGLGMDNVNVYHVNGAGEKNTSNLSEGKSEGKIEFTNDSSSSGDERQQTTTKFSEVNVIEEIWHSKQVVNRSSIYTPTRLSTEVSQVLVNNATCFAEGKPYNAQKVCFTTDDDNDKILTSYFDNQANQENKSCRKLKEGEKDEDEQTLSSKSAPHGYGIKDLICGSTYTLALTTSGHVYQWGTVNGKIYPIPNKVPIAFPLRVIQVASGRKHALALLEGGFVVSWGCGYFGQLGHGDDHSYDKPKMIHHLDPQRIGGGDRVVKIACGGMHSVVSTDGQAIYSFGFNRYGQCGTGNCSNKISTPRVASTTHLVDLEFNENHEINLQDRSVYNSAEQIAAIGRIKSLVCGRHHSCFLTDKGRVFSWGATGFGRLGIPMSMRNIRSTASQGKTLLSGNSGLPASARVVLLPTEIPFFRTVPAHQIAAGDFHMLAVGLDYRCYSWGYSSEGQGGSGFTLHLRTPRLVEIYDDELLLKYRKEQENWSISGENKKFNPHSNRLPNHVFANIESVSCGSNCSFAISLKGEVFAWGYADAGNCGVDISELLSSQFDMNLKENAFRMKDPNKTTIQDSHEDHGQYYNNPRHTGNGSLTMIKYRTRSRSSYTNAPTGPTGDADVDYKSEAKLSNEFLHTYMSLPFVEPGPPNLKMRVTRGFDSNLNLLQPYRIGTALYPEIHVTRVISSGNHTFFMGRKRPNATNLEIDSFNEKKTTSTDSLGTPSGFERKEEGKGNEKELQYDQEINAVIIKNDSIERSKSEKNENHFASNFKKRFAKMNMEMDDQDLPTNSNKSIINNSQEQESNRSLSPPTFTRSLSSEESKLILEYEYRLPIFRSCRANKLQDVQLAIDEGFPIEITEYVYDYQNIPKIGSSDDDNSSETASSTSSKENDEIKEKTKASCITDTGNTLLHVAAANNLRNMCRLCIRNGANIDTQNKVGNTPLHMAFMYGYHDLGAYLISRGANDNILNSNGYSCYEM